MLNKIFLLLLAVSIIVMSALTFFSYTWLQSVDKPANVVANFEFYAGFAWTALWISSLILLIYANVLLWTNRSIWGLWSSFLYFAVFILHRKAGPQHLCHNLIIINKKRTVWIFADRK